MFNKKLLVAFALLVSVVAQDPGYEVTYTEDAAVTPSEYEEPTFGEEVGEPVWISAEEFFDNTAEEPVTESTEYHEESTYKVPVEQDSVEVITTTNIGEETAYSIICQWLNIVSGLPVCDSSVFNQLAIENGETLIGDNVDASYYDSEVPAEEESTTQSFDEMVDMLTQQEVAEQVLAARAETEEMAPIEEPAPIEETSTQSFEEMWNEIVQEELVEQALATEEVAKTVPVDIQSYNEMVDMLTQQEAAEQELAAQEVTETAPVEDTNTNAQSFDEMVDMLTQQEVAEQVLAAQETTPLPDYPSFIITDTQPAETYIEDENYDENASVAPLFENVEEKEYYPYDDTYGDEYETEEITETAPATYEDLSGGGLPIETEAPIETETTIDPSLLASTVDEEMKALCDKLNAMFGITVCQ